MKKVVLAYSGGLDTSYCAIYLSREKGFRVHAATVNTGGFDENEIRTIKEKSLELGVHEYECLDEIENFYQNGVKYLLFGNVLKNNTYPLSVSAERVFQAMAIANYAKSINADAIAHGSTGAGNDQIRFDLVFQSICPKMEIITPIRDQSLSREQEINYLKSQGVEANWEKARYSINQGLWGTSVGGKETLTSDQFLPEDAFPKQLLKDKPETITITFEKGEPTEVDGKTMKPVEVIHRLNKLAGDFAIGRDVHVGDTIIGIKGRVGFEAPGPMVLIKAHHALEKHVLSKHQLFIKEGLAQWYGNLMHEGQYLDPVMRDIEHFLQNGQEFVEGKVHVRLAPYHFQVLGIESPHDLMQSSFGQYGEENKQWTGEDAKGFARIYANQTKLIKSVQGESV